MSTERINITLGTAGHIDHGKTALIKCLTGCDTDHLKAEKERGMSIELGFAPCYISGLEIGIVDVPGHENFIKTMVAGTSAIDGVIFVIAADDGVMPQTREHLDILTLLGVKHGIVALTKNDCVRPERLETVTIEVRNFLEDTFLEDAPIVPVSGITGQGFDVFLEELKNVVEKIQPKRIDTVFRMPIEKAFSLRGHGTVITGIPVAGSIDVGNEVILLPKAIKGRIKAIQVYKRKSDTAMSGQCAAINITKFDYKTIQRGNVVTVGKYFSPQQWYLCNLNVLRSCTTKLKTGVKVKFHTGTTEVVATMYLLQSNVIAAGQQGLVQLKLHAPVVAAPGDRFIIRILSPVRTVGGGMIIEAIPARLKRNKPGVIEEALARCQAASTEKDFVQYCIRTAADMAATETQIALRAKVTAKKLKELLAELINEGKVTRLGTNLFMHSEVLALITQKLVNDITQFHNATPASPGIRPEELCELSGLQKDVFEGVVELLLKGKIIVERKTRLAMPQHCETFTEKQKQLIDSVEELFRERLFNPPNSKEVAEHLNSTQQDADKTIKILTEQGRLVRVENVHLFHCEAIEEAGKRLRDFIGENGCLESVKFKYLIDTTRKYAIPLLDHFDRIGVTSRAGNTRYLKNR